MTKNILLICIGNICRSPMAEGLMRQKLPEMAMYFAGQHTLGGASVDRFARDAAWNNDTSIRGCRAPNLHRHAATP